MYRIIEKIKKLDKIKTPATVLGMSGALLVALPAAAPRMFGFASWMIAKDNQEVIS
jgi:hypothetical protein